MSAGRTATLTMSQGLLSLRGLDLNVYYGGPVRSGQTIQSDNRTESEVRLVVRNPNIGFIFKKTIRFEQTNQHGVYLVFVDGATFRINALMPEIKAPYAQGFDTHVGKVLGNGMLILPVSGPLVINVLFKGEMKVDIK